MRPPHLAKLAVLKREDVQRLQRAFLLLGALAAFVLFTPHRLIFGVLVFAALSPWVVPRSCKKRCSRPLRRRRRPRPASWRHGLSPMLGRGGSSQAQLVDGNDGDCGPSLVLVFEARDPHTQRERLRICRGSSGNLMRHGTAGGPAAVVHEERTWDLEPISSEVSDEEPLRGHPRARTCPVTTTEILTRLKAAGLEYRLGPSKNGEFIFCVVRLPELTARVNLKFYPEDLQLHATNAHEYAAALGMPLAMRARRPDGLGYFDAGDHIGLARSVTNTFGELAPQARAAAEGGLPPAVWRSLYVRFMPTVPSALFRHFAILPSAPSRSPSERLVGKSRAGGGGEDVSNCGSSSDLESECDVLEDLRGFPLEVAPPPVPRPPRLSLLLGTPHVGLPTDSPVLSVSPRGQESPRQAPGQKPPPMPPAVAGDGARPAAFVGPGGLAAVQASPAPPAPATLLPPSVRLRLLMRLVSDDLPGALGTRGPGLKLDQWRKPKLWNCVSRTCVNFGVGRPAEEIMRQLQLEVPSAFLVYFLLQDPRDAAYRRLCEKFGHPLNRHFWSNFWRTVADKRTPATLRHYFGEQIAFYFAFMQHLLGYGLALTVLLAPLLACYSVSWAKRVALALGEQDLKCATEELVQGLACEIATSTAAQDRWPLWSLLIGLTTIVWGQCVIESWRRCECRLAKEWGSSRVDARPTPRSRFLGRMALSPIDGRLTRVHSNWYLYCVRIVTANILFLMLTLLFASCVFFMSRMRMERRISKQQFAVLGAFYSVLTATLQSLCNAVAQVLTEAENHRSEQPFEASLIVKKWMITVIVQTWAIAYLLFIRPVTMPCAYGDDDIRRRLGVQDCAPHDGACCDVELRRVGQVILSFAQVRNEAVITYTREFVAGWLLSKILLFQTMKWLVPRLLGFICMRGVYPCFVVDFAQDLLDDLASQSGGSPRRRVRRRRCCCCMRRRGTLARTESYLWSRDTTVEAGLTMEESALPETITRACELQLDKQEPLDILQDANDLSVHFLVTSLTTVIYPFAPLLFLTNLLIEYRMELFRLFDRRQPRPRSARGLPLAWICIFQSYVYVGAASNLAIVAYRTDLVRDLLHQDDPGTLFAFFSTTLLLLVVVVSLVQLLIPPMPEDVSEHLQRQQEVEAFFAGAAGGFQPGDSAFDDLPMRRSVSWGPSLECFLGHAPDLAGENRPLAKSEIRDTRRPSSGPGASPGVHGHGPGNERMDDAEVRSLWEAAQKVR